MPELIKYVEAGSPAQRAGILAGDILLSVGGKEIHDVLDYKFYTYEPTLTVFVQRSGEKRRFRINKREGEDPGLVFETYLMDKERRCSNHCVFCFIDQLPKGLRETLYFKDDDARLSFLLGNYITLTNLSEREISRIIDLRISPINISVHTTNPELRVKMLRNRRAGEVLDVIKKFADAGISMNAQIVCCPGLNDGEELERTMRDLSCIYPELYSCSIVPVGITKYRDGLFPLRQVTADEAIKIVKDVNSYGEACLERFGGRVFYAADELYLLAGLPIPEAGYYEDYPQLENGVGMMRLFEEEFINALSLTDATAEPPSFSVATGVSAAPFIEKLLSKAREKWYNIDYSVYAVKNDFFGHTVDVAGLVTGGDLIAQLTGRDLKGRLLIPASMLRHGGDVFLDGVTLSEAEKELSVPVVPISQDGEEFLRAITAK